jgi:predicted CXXCH cytochrome family protein
MKIRTNILLCVSFLLAAGRAPAQQTGSIQNSPHNLSASGPGAIHAASEQEICIFCHTPHNSAPVQPLWNRNTPVSAYTVYSSNSLKAKPGQPTGSSKLCLSCHDGTIALGSVLSRGATIQMASGITTLPPGAKSNLGTDLSDDHPISFMYDQALVTRNPKLKPPNQLPRNVHLDARGELQCTTCHEAHDNSRGSFLVMDNSRSQLCTTCHQMGTTTIAAHQGCNSCHQTHTAPSGPYLLKAAKESDSCLTCHGGRPAGSESFGQNIAADLSKSSRHDTASPVNQANHVPNNSTCSDCHGPHSMKSGVAVAPTVPPNFGQVSGVDASGATVATAQFAYEVCFKCHAEQKADTRPISRQLVQWNKRLQFAPSAISSHPVEGPGKSSDVTSLAPGWTTASTMYCSDCHNSDAGAKAGGTGPGGVHGSSVRGLLALGYETTDNTIESATAYALCYKCHQRSMILADAVTTPDQPFPLHAVHVINGKTPCSICHDSHGVSSAQGNVQHNSHLMNFDRSIVQPDPATGRLEYISTGPRSGTCFLSCHNVPHSPLSYGNATAPMFRRATKAQPAAPAAPVGPGRPVHGPPTRR